MTLARDDDPFWDVFERLVRAGIFKQFGSRPHLNRERWLSLQINKSFLADLESMRERFDVPPTLKFESDMEFGEISVGEKSVDVAESTWVKGLSSGKLMEFENAVKSILIRYKLPLNFHDFVEQWILYREVPDGEPLFNWELIFQISDDPNEVKRIPLNKMEKRFVLMHFRRMLGIEKGRIPKKFAAQYKRLRQYLSQSKNTSRRSRAVESAIATVRLKDAGKEYLDVAGELYPDADSVNTTSMEADRKIAARLRKQKSRFLKRNIKK